MIQKYEARLISESGLKARRRKQAKQAVVLIHSITKDMLSILECGAVSPYQISASGIGSSPASKALWIGM